jgi:hypothetical protein
MKDPTTPWLRLARLARALPPEPPAAPPLGFAVRILADAMPAAPNTALDSLEWQAVERVFRRLVAALAAVMLLSLAVNWISQDSNGANAEWVELSRLITSYAL